MGGVGKGIIFTVLVAGTTSSISGGKFGNGAMTGAFVHLFNTLASVIASGISKQGTKKVLEENLAVDAEAKTMIISSSTGFIGGVVGGATAGVAMGPLGILIGAVSGGIYGLAGGMFTGYVINRSLKISEVKMIANHIDTLKHTAEGFVEHQKRKLLE